MNRTVRIQLHPTPEQARALTETLAQFTIAFNEVCASGWQHQEKNGGRLHHLTYYPTKERCPGLVSDLLIQARVKATEALKSVFDRKARGRKVSQPRSRHCPVRYNKKTYTLNWETHTVRLSTSAGKLSIPFQVPSSGARYWGAKVATADLCVRKGKYWLHVVVSLPEPDVAPTAEVIGVDLGLNRPAVTSTRRFLGQRHWKEVDRRHFRLRRALQSKGTKSARRHQAAYRLRPMWARDKPPASIRRSLDDTIEERSNTIICKLGATIHGEILAKYLSTSIHIIKNARIMLSAPFWSHHCAVRSLQQ